LTKGGEALPIKEILQYCNAYKKKGCGGGRW
jgi:hypothetical protein